jgi:hypothetical protein
MGGLSGPFLLGGAIRAEAGFYFSAFVCEKPIR